MTVMRRTLAVSACPIMEWTSFSVLPHTSPTRAGGKKIYLVWPTKDWLHSTTVSKESDAELIFVEMGQCVKYETGRAWRFLVL
jgi:hypothetical protein